MALQKKIFFRSQVESGINLMNGGKKEQAAYRYEAGQVQLQILEFPVSFL